MASPAKSLRLLLNSKISASTSPKALSPVLTRSSVADNTSTSATDRYLQVPNFQNGAVCNETTDRRNKPRLCYFEDVGENERSTFLINTPNKLRLLKQGVTNENGITNILGKGKFGTVFEAIYNGRRIAVKVVQLPKGTAEGANYKLNEVNALNLCHRNIIETVDIIINKNEAYGLVLMEYFENSKDLQSILNDSCVILNDQIVIKIFKDIVSGVDFCHKNGILHLDLKPKNVLLCDGVGKICDFGNSVKVTELSQTDYSKLKGTVIYTAPEILCGRKPSEKSDVYSLGILLWQMIFRRTPYDFLDNEFVVIYKVVKLALRPDSGGTVLKDKFSDLYHSCWKGSPDERLCLTEINAALSFMMS